MAQADIMDEVTYCAVHPDRETSLRCNKCDRLMCSKCAVQTPVGYRCRECINQIQSGYYNANSADLVITFAVCAVLTGLGSAIIAFTGLPIFFMLFFGLPVGGLVSEVALRLTSKRRSRNTKQVAAVGAVLGGIAGAVMVAALRYSDYISAVLRDVPTEFQEQMRQQLPSFTEYLTSALFDFSVILFVGLVAVAIYGRYQMRS